ncbi:MAG: SdiA-regulated domain-containing protein [Myxococcota bacterium]
MAARLRFAGPLLGLFICVSGPLSAKTRPWPAAEGSQIHCSGEAAGDSEPSGAVWHPRLQRLLVVSDEGTVMQMAADGSEIETWFVGGDLEAIAIADPEGTLAYLGLETPERVLEFDLASGALTGRGWDLSPWMAGRDEDGLEALTVVEGRFYAGHQADGRIYVFELAPDGGVEHIDTFRAPRHRADLSGLDYHADVRRLFAIHDTLDLIVEMRPDGTFLREFELPGADQEGIAVRRAGFFGQATIFIAEDGGGVWRYDDYPIVYRLLGIPIRRVAGWGLGSLGLLAGLLAAVRWRRTL